MQHIKQKNSSLDDNKAYTIVITEGYGGLGEPPLSEHPSIVENPTLFEIVNDDPPADAQFLRYV
jgi:hypothetical protein